MYAVYVNNTLIQGAYLHVKKDSIEIDDIIEARTTGKFTIVDVIGNQAYYQGTPVSVYDDSSNLIFAGFVATSKARRLGPASSMLEHDLTLIDNHYIADKRIAACSYTSPVNLLTNGSFENGDPPTGWAAGTGATLSRVTSPVKIGAYSLKVLINSPSNAYAQQTINAVPYRGQTVTLGCWINSAVTNNGTLYYWEDAWININSATTSFDGLWHWITFTTTVSAGANTIYISLSGLTVGAVYFDGAILVVGSLSPQNGPLSCGYIINDLITQYLAAEGVTVGLVQDGATLNTCVFNYVPVSQAIDELATASNFIWYIGYDRKLYFLDRNTFTAPFAVTSNMIWTFSNGGFTRGNSQYRNQQYVRGAKATTALQTESQKGDGVSRAFTVSYPVAKAPTSITVNSVAKTIGIKGVDTGKDFYWAKDDTVIAQDSSGTLLGTGDTFAIQYYGEYEIVAVATSDDQVAAQHAIEGAGTGIVEEVEVAKSVTDQATALNDALALLAEYAVQGQQFEFVIYQSGLKSGQMVPVTYAPHGLNNTSMLIEQIKTQRINNHFEYTVTAVTGPALGDWSEYFKKLEVIGKSFVTDVMVGDASTSLVRLKQFSETWTWTQTLTPTIIVCNSPASSLFPDTGIYPC